MALVVLEDRLRQNPSVLRQHGLERADFSAGMLNREGTYVIRVYAEFATEETPLSHVRRFLCRFLSHLPEDW